MIRQWSQDFAVIADIGAHHGHLAKHLATDGHRVIATEFSVAGFDALDRELQGSGATVIRGDGLHPLLDQPVDLVIIAGMGCDTIFNILGCHQKMKSHPLYLVQPVQGAFSFHRAIIEQAWSIAKAELSRYRNRYYATWLLDVHHPSQYEKGLDTMTVPREFSHSPWYAEWIRAERDRCVLSLQYQKLPWMPQVIDCLTRELYRIEVE